MGQKGIKFKGVTLIQGDQDRS